MESLLELREQLDIIDEQIVELYEKRMEICRKVGVYKRANNRPVLDKKREQEKILQVTQNTSCDYYKKGLTELFELLMAQSRELQEEE